MSKIRKLRLPVNAELVEKIVHIRYSDDFMDKTVPDGCWDFHFLRRQGKVSVYIAGAKTYPVKLPFQKNDDLLSVEFKPNAFLPHFPAITLLDCKTFLPFEESYFLLGEERFEVPTFDTVEKFVHKMIKRHIMANNSVVEAVVKGKPYEVCQRSIQRHFRQATGMTWKHYQQIKRAHHAVQLIKDGKLLLDVAFEVGYADQSHMTRSLKKILGQTPHEILLKS